MKRLSLISSTLLVVLSCARTACASPQIGTTAPALHFSKLLQAPGGARTDWASLRGKTVVLEFWATWCGPCVAAIPELNRLVASLDPNMFVVIAVDDEDPKIIETFVGRKKMASWVAEDADGATLKAYGVATRPATFVIGPNGKVADITMPDKLTRNALLSIANGKAVRGEASRSLPKSLPEPSFAAVTANDEVSCIRQQEAKALFEVSVQPSSATSISMSHDPEKGELGWEGLPDWVLWSMAYDLPKRRFTFTGPPDSGTYDYLVTAPGVNHETLAPILQLAVRMALKAEVIKTEARQKAWVLRKTESSVKLLSPPASPMTPESAYVKDGKELIAANASVSDVASALENFLDVPVLDDTGIGTIFDADVLLTSKDPVVIGKAIMASLGLSFTEEEREVATYSIQRKVGTSKTARNPSTGSTAKNEARKE